MNEQPRENIGEDFVAPDESRQVTDPEKARTMADESDLWQEPLSTLRKKIDEGEAEYKRLKPYGKTDPAAQDVIWEHENLKEALYMGEQNIDVREQVGGLMHQFEIEFGTLSPDQSLERAQVIEHTLENIKARKAQIEETLATRPVEKEQIKLSRELMALSDFANRIEKRSRDLG